MKKKGNDKVNMIVTLGLLAAMEIILSRWLSFQTWNFKISFSFIPVVIAAILYGPIAAGMVAGVADIIGALLFPIGAFFPGFTLTAFLNGVVYGVFLKKKQSKQNVILAVTITNLIGSLLLNSFWISMLYGVPFFASIPLRFVQNILLIVAELIMIPILVKVIIPKLRALVL